MVVIGRSLLIFSDVTFKIAAWWPYWSFWFPDSNFSLAFNINSKLLWQSTYIYGLEPIDFQLISKWPPGSQIGFFGFPDSNFSLALNMNSKLQCPNTSVYKLELIDFQLPHFLNGCLVAILDFLVSGLCRRHGFGSITQVCFGISVSHFMCMSFEAVGRSLTYVQLQSTHCPFLPSPMGRGYPSRSLIYNF